MAGAQGRMAEVSVTTDRFLDFFGLAYLQVEGSSTARPLDSLLHPTNSMDGAQRQFAKSFGADYAFFVTNGTSTANKVVHAGLLSPGEIVCIDRNCHISHHYAMALTRAVPWYLEPFETEVPGISGGVPAERVADAIRTIISTTSSGTTARYARLPALIALTNCTFDGHICDPSRVFRSVVDVLQEFDISDRLYEIAFLFDEAWFSFGFFHPAFHKQTALGSAKNLSYEPASGRYWEQNLRVYVTQSLHKTGGAFRQASVVLVRDPKLYWAQERLAQTGCSSKVDLGLERRLHQAYLCHTSTSPSLPILASIDVARRQLDIEGVRLVESALKSARSFRAIASTPAKPGVGARLQDVFRPAEAEELIPENLRREFLLDPTKITLRSTRGVSGKSCRDLLWDCDAKIQVNKYASDSVLFMFMPGITDNWVGKLVQGMNRAAARMLETPLSGLTPHDSTDLSLPRSPFLETEFVDEHGRTWGGPRHGN